MLEACAPPAQQGVAADNRQARPSASPWRLPQNAATLARQPKPMQSPWSAPADIEDIRLIDHPRSAVVRSRDFELTLARPEPLDALAAFLDACEIQIHDVNQESGGQLEYGRYRVEAWDEDAVLATVHCDGFDVLPTSAAPAAPTLTLLVLRCADLASSKAFYETLGLQWQSEQHGSGPKHWSCSLGDVVIELNPSSEQSPSAHRLGLRVLNLDLVLEAIPRQGGVVLSHDAGARRAVVRSPDGTKIELSEPS